MIVVVRACSADIYCFLFRTECRISREQQLVRLLLLGLGFVFDVRLPSGSVQKLGKTIYRIEGVTKLEIHVRHNQANRKTVFFLTSETKKQ